MYTHPLIFLVLLGMASTAPAFAQRGRGPAGPPDIVGKWTGVWSSYNPAQATTPPKEQCARLDATVAEKAGVYTATFEGDCGRPYKYTISMKGQLAGSAVMFKGSADLGPKDGGVYDWIGRATTNEFIGFYTNAFSSGTFSLKKVAAE
jgi:hypothetical protein